MSDLPELKNEPTVDLSRGDLADFARGYRSAPDRRDHGAEEPRKSRFRYAPTLLPVLAALVAGWHWIAATHYESELTNNLASYVRKNLPDTSVSVDVHPLTNLIEIQVTRNVARKEAAFELFGDAIIEYVRQELEPKMERELSVVARRDVDLYAMMVPYQVSISIDKVREPPAPPPSRMVQEIQRQLNARGYDAGPADGRSGQRTRSAIVKFQQDQGLPQDGSATGELLDLIMRHNSLPHAVAEIQLSLARIACAESVGGNRPDIEMLGDMETLPDTSVNWKAISVEQRDLLRKVAKRLAAAHEAYGTKFKAADRPMADFDTHKIIGNAVSADPRDEAATRVLQEIYEAWPSLCN